MASTQEKKSLFKPIPPPRFRIDVKFEFLHEKSQQWAWGVVNDGTNSSGGHQLDRAFHLSEGYKAGFRNAIESVEGLLNGEK